MSSLIALLLLFQSGPPLDLMEGYGIRVYYPPSISMEAAFLDIETTTGPWREVMEVVVLNENTEDGLQFTGFQGERSPVVRLRLGGMRFYPNETNFLTVSVRFSPRESYSVRGVPLYVR